jgi:hypothetical protein
MKVIYGAVACADGDRVLDCASHKVSSKVDCCSNVQALSQSDADGRRKTASAAMRVAGWNPTGTQNERRACMIQNVDHIVRFYVRISALHKNGSGAKPRNLFCGTNRIVD